jgi:glycerol-3-phosphate dehydrogenase (NAD(P)+)
MARVVVLGAGMMGTALCTPVSDAGHDVQLVGTHLDQAWVEGMKRDRVHPKLGVPLPDRVTPRFLSEIEDAMRSADFLCLGVSSAGVLWAARTIAPFLRPSLPVLSVTKGLAETSPGTLRVLPDVLRDALPPGLQPQLHPGAIGGPCIAGEIARRVPTAVVFTARDLEAMERCASAFATPYYHVRPSADVVGVEVCAALKNAYAMAIGIGAGLHERAGGMPAPVAQHNYEAAIFAQSCLEMDLLVRALGGGSAQVVGLPGAGDLFVTCSGGRSSRLGRHLGLGKSFEEARAAMAGDTLESADTVRVVGGALDRMIASDLLPSGALPLMRHLHQVIVEGMALSMPFDQFFRGSPQ